MSEIIKQTNADDYDDDTSMVIGLDYDDTYTRDPKMWDKIIKRFHKSGCKVCLISDRDPDDGDIVEAHLEGIVDDFYFTNGKAKKVWMLNKGHKVDIWIDDTPENIIYDKDDSSGGEGKGPYSTKND